MTIYDMSGDYFLHQSPGKRFWVSYINHYMVEMPLLTLSLLTNITGRR